MEAILKSWAHVARFIIILLLIGLMIFVGFLAFNKYLSKSQISLEFTDSKTIVKIKNDDQLITQSILAASDCWEKTGININPGESYKIKVTGKIHTAADYLLRDVANDTIPMFQWAGAEGRPFRIREGNFKTYDELRRKCLIDPNACVGSVLFYFQEDPDKAPSCQGGDKFNPRPKNIRVYDPAEGILEGTNSGDKIQHLWASVNDMLVFDSTEDSKWAYIGASLDNKQLEKKLAKWEYIKKSDYKKFWFDDNIGNYIISIIITD